MGRGTHVRGLEDGARRDALSMSFRAVIGVRRG